MTPQQSILNILNPVHHPFLIEMEKIASIIIADKTGGYLPIEKVRELQYEQTHKLIQRYEHITRGKWVECDDCGGTGSYSGDPESYCKKCETGVVFHPAILEKKHFVSGVEKPNQTERELSESESNEQVGLAMAYQAAQQEVLFEGFEENVKNVFSCNGFKLDFDGNTMIYSSAGIAMPKTFIVLDFITEIDRYNRTASKPIELNWTPAIADKLLKP